MRANVITSQSWSRPEKEGGFLLACNPAYYSATRYIGNAYTPGIQVVLVSTCDILKVFIQLKMLLEATKAVGRLVAEEKCDRNCHVDLLMAVCVYHCSGGDFAFSFA